MLVRPCYIPMQNEIQLQQALSPWKNFLTVSLNSSSISFIKIVNVYDDVKTKIFYDDSADRKRTHVLNI